MLKFFRIPFAYSGDKAAVPDTADAGGNVSYSQGYTFDYQRQKTDPLAKNIERDKNNQLWFDVTNAISELQGRGVPDFITSALNGGTAYSYGINALVRYGDAIYRSLVNANTSLPTDAAKWALLPVDALTLEFIAAGTGAVSQTAWGKMRQVITTDDFGCAGDGATDTTTAMQNFLTACAGKIGVVMPGTYLCGTLTISSGTTLVGHGANVSIIKAKATLAGNAPLLKNATQTGGVNTYPNRNITIAGIQFNGNGLGSRVSELLSFGKTRNTVLRECRVTNVGYIGIGFGGCRATRVINCEVDATGNPVITAEGGAGIWFGNAGDGSKCLDSLVQGCELHDMEWAAIYAGSDRCRIIGNDIANVKEAGIFSSFFIGLTISDNNIDGVTKKNISASGIETGAVHVNISGNIIKNVANCCVALTDTQNVTITGNTLAECRQDSASYPQGSMIGVVTQSAFPNQPRWLSIVGNTAIGISSSPYAFLTIGNSGAAATEVIVTNNNCSGVTFTSGNGFQVTGKWGSNCEHRDNLGIDDFARGVTAIVTTATSPANSVATTLNFDSAPVNSEGMWVVGAPSRITIPINVTRVRLTAQVTFVGNASGIRKASILKNGSAGFVGHAEAIVPTVGAAYSQAVNISTGVINVVPGDYFELQCLQDSGGALALIVGEHFTWLALEVL